MNYHLAIKRNDVLTAYSHVDEPWRHHPKQKRNRYRSSCSAWFHVYGMPGMEGRWWLSGTWFLSGLMKMFWNALVVMVSQLCEYTRNHCIIQFKRMNFTVCEFYVNKTINFLNAHIYMSLVSYSWDHLAEMAEIRREKVENDLDLLRKNLNSKPCS